MKDKKPETTSHPLTETTAVIPACLEMSKTKRNNNKRESVVVVKGDLLLMRSSRLKSQPGLKPDVGMPKGGGGGWMWGEERRPQE